MHAVMRFYRRDDICLLLVGQLRENRQAYGLRAYALGHGQTARMIPKVHEGFLKVQWNGVESACANLRLCQTFR